MVVGARQITAATIEHICCNIHLATITVKTIAIRIIRRTPSNLTCTAVASRASVVYETSIGAAATICQI